MILGFSRSNLQAENGLLTAKHCLVAWGSALRNRSDHVAALDLLATIQEITGYPTRGLAERLRASWES